MKRSFELFVSQFIDHSIFRMKNEPCLSAHRTKSAIHRVEEYTMLELGLTDSLLAVAPAGGSGFPGPEGAVPPLHVAPAGAARRAPCGGATAAEPLPALHAAPAGERPPTSLPPTLSAITFVDLLHLPRC